MGKQRRSAIDEVLGGASPVARKIRAQKEAARLAREEGAASEEESDRKPPESAQAASSASTTGNSGGGVNRQEPPHRNRTKSGQVKRRPAKRIPVMGNEGEVWEDVCRTLSGCVGAKVTFAAASRAIWSMVVEIEDALNQFDAPQLAKPANADVLGNADFEDQLKEFIREVLVKGKRS